ncbi:MAG: translocation/assembly module TamB domain-containing protein [bacterium]
MFSKNKLLYIVLFVSIIYAVASSFLWEKTILDSLNRSLSKSKVEVISGELSGNLLRNIIGENFEIIHPIYGNVYIEKILINYDYFGSLFGVNSFDEIYIDSLVFDSKKYIEDNQNTEFESFPIQINKFSINGQLPLWLQNEMIIFKGIAEGQVAWENELNLKIDRLSLENSGEYAFSFQMDNFELFKNDDSLSINNFSGKFGNAPINGELLYFQKESKIKGSLNIDEFAIPKELFSKTPLKGKFEKISGNVDFESISGDLNGNLSISNQLGLEMAGNINIVKDNGNILLKNLNLYGEDSNLKVNGVWEGNERLSGYFYLDSLDLSRWLIEQNPTLLSGMAILEGSIDNNQALENIELTLEVAEYGVLNNQESSFHGTVLYSDSIVSTVDPVMLIIGESILSIDGELNLKSKELNFISDLENADIKIINNFWMDEFTDGIATGKLIIRGSMDNPDVVADLNCKNIKYKDFSMESINFHSEMESDSNFPSGFVNLKIDKGIWRNEKFDSGTLDISFSKNRMVVENCHFKSGDDYLLLSGSWLSKNKYRIDRIQSAYKDNYLVNAKPIFISYQDTAVYVEPFEIHINDGILDGVLLFGAISEGRLKMANFDARVITQFIDSKYLDLSGIVFGELSFQNLDNDLSYDVDIALKKGNYLGKQYDQMNLSFLLNSNKLIIDDFSFTADTSLGFELSGILPFKKSNKPNAEVSLNTTFKDLPLEMVHRLIPNFFNLEGDATGLLNIGGNLGKTNFNYEASIDHAVFDKIYLGSLKSKGSYNGSFLSVEYAESNNNLDRIISSGDVPFDLNLNSDKFGQFFENKNINYTASAKLTSMPFLSTYITELDSISGTINIDLSLSGPSSAIIRNGEITLSNSNVYTMLINNPIISVNGKGVLENNILNIENLKGSSVNTRDNNFGKIRDNISVSGSIDFSKFFEPKYDLIVNSINNKYIYLDAIPIDITGIIDSMNVKVFGKDTVNITGLIEVDEATLFHEFISEDIGETLISSDGVVMSYSLNVPIKDEGKFQNSQVDAIMTGEISLAKTGNEYWNIGGEVYIEDGSILSFKDNFTGLNGYVIFDNNGINPDMDLMASTTIADEEIRLKIKGDLNNADLVLESSSGFSESDIIELLTFGSRFEDQALSSNGFGVQATSMLGSLLETQLEKNLEEMSALKLLKPDEIDVSGTASFISGQNLSASEKNDLEDFKISAKKKFGSKTYANLSYKKSFSLTNPDQLQIGVEYKLNRNLSLVGNMDDKGNLHLKYRYRYAY